MSNLRTLIWTTIRLVPEAVMEAQLSNPHTFKPTFTDSIAAVTLELEWPHALPERGHEWCITDLARTELESVAWWPTEEPPCRVLHMRPIYVTDRAEFDEVCRELYREGARNPYAT